MLEYEWGNPSTVMFTGNEDAAAASAASVAAAVHDSDQAHHQMFDHYGLLPNHLISQPQHEHAPTTASSADFSLHHQFSPQQTHHQHHQQQQHIHNSLFDPRAFPGASAYPSPQQPPSSMLSLDPLTGTVNAGHGLLVVPKSEDVGRSVDFTTSRIGLNLGGRTYFSSEDDFVNRLYRRARPAEPGFTTSFNSPRCQAEGCNADLSHAKHYHRRHKVCEFHSKAATVIAAGLTQRFCQQCSRFHLLSEFDNGKRSCRKRLADHNRRRRKTQQPIQEMQKCQVDNNARNSRLDNVTRSPQDSGAPSTSSVTVAISPPDYFRQRPYQNTGSSTSNSLFFSSV